MFLWRLPRAVCMLSACLCLVRAYGDDDIEVNYSENYYNEIPDGDSLEPSPSPGPCTSSDLTKWDKLFSMLENSQMRENMLLQNTDDIIKVEIGSLREEIIRMVSQYSSSCGYALETTARMMSLQLESKLKESLEAFKLKDQNSDDAGHSVGNSKTLEALLQQLILTSKTQTSRLAKLEISILTNAKEGSKISLNTGSEGTELGSAANPDQEITAKEATLEGVLAALQQVRGGLDEVLRSSKQRYIPAGYEMVLLFPMRSRRIFATVIPDAPLSLSSFTVCMWVKPTIVSNKTVLLSYGNRRNPFEIQLLLGHSSALFTVGGEAHLVEARGVVKPGGSPEWIHLCGTWSSDQGMAALWADGKKVAHAPGVAEGHVIPKGGSLQLGQERNGCCTNGAMPGFEAGFESELAFAGKMTGVNLWDRVLSEEEISQLALPEGHGGNQSGNMVAWGVTEMVPHGGAQFII